MFTLEAVESYLRDLLLHENFVDGIMTMHLARDPSINERVNTDMSDANESHHTERIEISEDEFVRFSLMRNNITDFGLSFLFDVLKDLVISKEFIETLYRVIIKIVRTKLKPLE